jgi:hypothetical protein
MIKIFKVKLNKACLQHRFQVIIIDLLIINKNKFNNKDNTIL